MAERKKEGFLETIRTVVIAVAIALFVRTFFFEPFNIPSGSMIPTLEIGDYLFVSKYAYGYSHHTVALGTGAFDGRVLGSEPERGDVIVFRKPREPSIDFIKRLIGLPGDRIQMRGGRLYINDEMVEREALPDLVVTDAFGGERRIPRYLETLPNGVQHEILERRGDDGPRDDTREFIVPAGMYFFMGDNRDDSQDSRAQDVGFVPYENLVGRAEIIWFSLDDASFWEVWKWPTSLRYGRLLTFID